jgi:hypothetical protein
MRSTARLAALVGAALCAGVLAIPASAGLSASSRVTLKVAGGPPFHGRVISGEPACVSNRKVLLIELAPDRGPIDYADNRTNGKGKWVFSSELQGATVVQAKVGESKASGVRCRSALSPGKAL